MKHFLPLAFITLAAASAALAGENITRNGVTWNGTFEGDVSPSDSTPAWSIYANSGGWTANATSNPGSWTLDTRITSAGAWQVSTGFNNALSTGRTVEAKLKVGIIDSYPNAADGVVSLLVFSGSRYIEIRIFEGSISMKGNSTSTASVDMVSDFNTIRVTHDSTLSTDAWKLYLNSSSIPILSSGNDLGVALGSPFYAVVFGDLSTGGIGGESQWDYISWTDTGAFAPDGVPWNGIYRGDAFPSASTPVWSIYANSGGWTANTTSNPGSFTQYTRVGSAGAWQVSTGFSNPLSTGRTVEANLRLGISEDYPNADDGVVTLLVFSGSRYIIIRFSEGSISMVGTSTSSVNVDMLSDFNTIRVTHDSTLSRDAWKLYVGSIPVIFSGGDPGVALQSPSYAVVFGDPSSVSIGGQSEWDYIAWTDAGAFDFVPPPPSDLSYSPDSQSCTVGVAIASMTPSITGLATNYSVSPALPSGLSIDPFTGIISGTPTAASATETYTVTASNSGGSTTADVTLEVQSAPPPSDLSYSPDSQSGTVGVAIASMTPSITGLATNYSVSPALPSGLSIDPFTGIISGTPTAASATGTYTVTASNSGGSTTADVTLGVQSAYAAWAEGAPLDASNQLLYAIGGASSPTATDGIASSATLSSNVLSITAIVRTNDPALTVYGQSILNLASGTWITNDVSMAPSVDQGGVPAGTQRQIFSTPRATNDTRKFLRLQTTLQP